MTVVITLEVYPNRQGINWATKLNENQLIYLSTHKKEANQNCLKYIQ